MTDGGPRALTQAVPAGLTVRRESDARGDGPFRESVETTLVVEAARGGRVEARAPYAAAGCLLVLIMALAGSYQMAVGLGVALVASAVVALRRSSSRVLAITDDHLQLAGGKRLLLADVRRLAVVQRHDEERNREVACVVVHTPDAEVEIARVDERTQAEYIEELVDQAYRAHLQRSR